eukprot:m.27374 g.27374  ORF g.27374 m.27374 type:complete len:163 (-) comp8528_c0_seq1:116-604(-)
MPSKAKTTVVTMTLVITLLMLFVGAASAQQTWGQDGNVLAETSGVFAGLAFSALFGLPGKPTASRCDNYDIIIDMLLSGCVLAVVALLLGIILTLTSCLSTARKYFAGGGGTSDEGGSTSNWAGLACGLAFAGWILFGVACLVIVTAAGMYTELLKNTVCFS